MIDHNLLNVKRHKHSIAFKILTSAFVCKQKHIDVHNLVSVKFVIITKDPSKLANTKIERFFVSIESIKKLCLVKYLLSFQARKYFCKSLYGRPLEATFYTNILYSFLIYNFLSTPQSVLYTDLTATVCLSYLSTIRGK